MGLSQPGRSPPTTSCSNSLTTWWRWRSAPTSRGASPVTLPTRSCSASPLGRKRLRQQLPRASSGLPRQRQRQQRRQALPSARSSPARKILPAPKPSQASPARRSRSLQTACRKWSPRLHQEGVSAGPVTQRGARRVNSHRAARHAPPRQAPLPRERLTPPRQLERGLPGPPPLLLPSGRGCLPLPSPHQRRSGLRSLRAQLR